MIFLALVTFEHDGDNGEHLALSYQAACGWMAINADDSDGAVDVLRESLAADKLKRSASTLLMALSKLFLWTITWPTT